MQQYKKHKIRSPGHLVTWSPAQVSEHTVGKVRRLAEDVEALKAEEAEERKVLMVMLVVTMEMVFTFIFKKPFLT